MEQMHNWRPIITGFIGTVGAFFINILGGWDTALQTLLVFMTIDFLTGLTVAAVFQKSGKTKNGALESRAGWKGLCRKGMILVYVLIAFRLDVLLDIEYTRYAVIIGYILNEAISIVENAGLMGLDYPKPLKKAFEMLKDKNEGES